jgi:nitroimidazol reductase NimA-like FMN-containing flavoprotein (pyridoxamine 5'-phosphate oxidase superfamily)
VSALSTGGSFDRNGLQVIEEGECRELLATAAIGRLALSVEALPVVLPVNFALQTDGILIRTGGGTKFDAACDQSVVAFEVDGFDAMSHTGWSVLVQGHARILHAPTELHEARLAGLEPGANPAAEAYVKIGLDLITGRRIGGWYWTRPGVPPVPPPPSRA